MGWGPYVPYHVARLWGGEDPLESAQKRIQFQEPRNIVVTMIVPVPCLRDNYAYLIPNGAGGALVVDPGEAQPVQDALAGLGLTLEAILCTHHHRDHVGGSAELCRPGVEVVAHVSDRRRIPGLTRTVEDGETLELAGLDLRVLHVPGHTQGAVSYWLGEALFTGDTLFCAGCGRLLEGTAPQLHQSLCRLVRELPPDTVLYTGHEYTESNLRFAAAVEPDNPAIEARLCHVAERRRQGLFCAATTMKEELATNPFLRVDRAEVRAAVKASSAEASEVFRALRQWKDTF